jgi:fatty acid desaturase
MANELVDPYQYQPKTPIRKQKWLSCPQRADEIRALCKAHGGKHLLYGSPYIVVYLATVWAQLAIDRLWINIALSCVLANLIYTLFILQHDCMHGSAFRHDFLNRWVGRVYTLAFAMTFTVNRETHRRHHAYVADPERDPDEYYFAGRLHQIWLRIWRYIEWYTRIALTKYGTGVRRTVIVEQGFNFAFWALVHVALFQLGAGIKVVYLIWLPMTILVCVINPIMRGYEHCPITLYDDITRKMDMAVNTITVDSRWLGYLWANITFHVEHHAYPRCPFYNLQRVHRIFQQEQMQYLVAPFPLYGIHRGAALVEGLTCNATYPDVRRDSNVAAADLELRSTLRLQGDDTP